MNKRADFSGDSVFIFVWVFIIGILLFVIYTVVDDFNTEWQASSDISQNSKNIISDFNTKLPKVFDGMIAIVFFSYFIFVMVSAYYIRTRPVFFVVAVILFPILIWLVTSFGNTFNSLGSDSFFSRFSTTLPFTNHIMTYLVEFVVAISVGIAVALYSSGGGNR